MRWYEAMKMKKHIISRLVLNGYKSIFECDLELNPINLLIGANGSGKSNFIDFFRLLTNILYKRLQVAVGLAGGPDALLHFGRKNTEEIKACLYFGGYGCYRFLLQPTQDNKIIFRNEEIMLGSESNWRTAMGHFEAGFKEKMYRTLWASAVPVVYGLRFYHFHDAGDSSYIKRIHNINDNEYLREDARNLAAFLLRLQDYHNEHYQRIIAAIRLAAPFFGDFFLRPTLSNKEKIQLEWVEQGHDEPFPASDGTLRFICLATVLLQPDEFMPATLLIDEPELGLHPYAISVLASMMQSVAKKHQLIVSTQSVELVNEFSPEDLIIVEKHQGASTFKRPDSQMLADWLNDYSLGELWKKNLLGGRP